MYCSKCGGAMAAGSAFCATCGQTFSATSAALRAPLMNASMASLVPAGLGAAPACGVVPRVEYAGFWLRVLAFLIDNVLIGVAMLVVLIPLVFLTGLGALFSRIANDGDLNDAGIFLIIGILFAAGTASLLVTWLYHALMESSEWQATVGKKCLGLVVTDMAGQRVSFGRSTGRHFGKMITNLIPAFLGYIMAAFTERRQALHDMMSGCLVLRRG